MLKIEKFSECPNDLVQVFSVYLVLPESVGVPLFFCYSLLNLDILFEFLFSDCNILSGQLTNSLMNTKFLVLYSLDIEIFSYGNPSYPSFYWSCSTKNKTTFCLYFAKWHDFKYGKSFNTRFPDEWHYYLLVNEFLSKKTFTFLVY